jgi:hypothetical protein
MKTRSLFSAIIAGGICLVTQPQIQATDAEPAERFAPAPTEAGGTLRGLTDEQSFLSQLRHVGRIGGPSFGYEIRGAEVRGEMLIAPVFTSFDLQGQRVLSCEAETLELQVDHKRSQLFLRVRNGTVETADGSTGYFADRIFQMEFPRARPTTAAAVPSPIR